VGQRIRQLREEAGLTMEKLAFESELGSKGHLSNIERGLVRPTVQTLQVLADRLGVLLLDLVTFPERDERQNLIDRTRSLPRGTLKKLAKELDPSKLSLGSPPEPARKPRRRNKSEA
jgi:transcriptional regulator with XRE-family HTH domain